MTGLHPDAGAGKVNGLQRPSRVPGRHLRLPTRHPLSLVALGAGLYGTALIFPVVLHQVPLLAFLAAFTGTAVFLLGLHLRWSRPDKVSY